MSSQRYLSVWLCLGIVIIIASHDKGVHCRVRVPAREVEFDESEKDLFQDAVESASTLVTTTAGWFQGKFYRGYNQEYYTSFADIPYAKPPVGELRYKKPQPLEPVEDYVDASKSIDYEEIVTQCKQYVKWDGHAVNAEDRIVGEENCLYLDIIRPVGLEVEHKHRLAQDVLGLSTHADVMVFLHPGTFMYDIPMNHYQITEYFCCNFILFVFVRFRLGPLGFANLGPLSDDIVPNVGLWDQVAALKWVQRHIAAFGGDEKKVTLVGVAAGAASVNYHMMSSVSRGLFSKAISMGGSALNPWAFARHSVNNTLQLIEALGCPDFTKEQNTDCLMNADADDIVREATKLYAFQNLPINPFGPVVDGEFIHVEPDVLMRVNHTLAIDWLVSFSTDYSLYPNYDFVEDIHTEYTHERWFEVAPHIMGLKDRVDEHIMNDVTWDIREYYFSSASDPNPKFQAELGLNVTHDDPLDDWSSRDKINLMASDSMYTIGIVEAARLHALSLQSKLVKKGKKYDVAHDDSEDSLPEGPQVYLYKFNYHVTRLTDFLVDPVERWAKLHREDFSLLTKDYDPDEMIQTPAELEIEDRLRDTLVSVWGTFIKFGLPYMDVRKENEKKSTRFTFRHLQYKTEKPLDVSYTVLLGPPNYYLTLTSDNLGEMRLWRKLPLQIYEEYDDYANLPDDDGVYVPL